MKIVGANKDSIQNMSAQAVPEIKKSAADALKRPQKTETPDIIPEDAVEISAEAKRKAADPQNRLEEMRGRLRELREEMKRAREAGEGVAEAIKEKIRCIQIAMRIMSGNKVPVEDHQYLLEKDPGLYSQAISMKIEKDDPEEYDRLSEDEEDGEDTRKAAENDTWIAAECPQPDMAGTQPDPDGQ